MAKITAIVNQKGGVGKTTTALNLGYALSEKGKEVLLIDFDPQSSLTSALGYNAENKESIKTLMNLVIEEEELIERENYILNIKENLDLIPCSLKLFGIEMGLVNVISRELVGLDPDEHKKIYNEKQGATEIELSQLVLF